MKNVTSEWLRSADDDLQVIREIIDNVALTHMVAFHAQQAIEKSFKAVLEEFGETVPKIHSLETLLPKVRVCLHFPVELDLLEDLTNSISMQGILVASVCCHLENQGLMSRIVSLKWLMPFLRKSILYCLKYNHSLQPPVRF